MWRGKCRAFGALIVGTSLYAFSRKFDKLCLNTGYRFPIFFSVVRQISVSEQAHWRAVGENKPQNAGTGTCQTYSVETTFSTCQARHLLKKMPFFFFSVD